MSKIYKILDKIGKYCIWIAFAGAFINIIMGIFLTPNHFIYLNMFSLLMLLMCAFTEMACIKSSYELDKIFRKHDIEYLTLRIKENTDRIKEMEKDMQMCKFKIYDQEVLLNKKSKKEEVK
jgi:hypothetical protein